MYANCVILPLYKKNYVDRFSDILINKRMRSIEKFMNGLLIHPLIKNSQILFDFLSIQNEEDFNKKRKNMKTLMFIMSQSNEKMKEISFLWK